MWETHEIWHGQTPGGHDIKLWVNKGIGIWMDDTWRIQWSVSGAHRQGESFQGDQAMREGLGRIQTTIGGHWEQSPT
jgi:hypothetical protein